MSAANRIDDAGEHTTRPMRFLRHRILRFFWNPAFAGMTVVVFHLYLSVFIRGKKLLNLTRCNSQTRLQQVN